jgi:hypothetical protein
MERPKTSFSAAKERPGKRTIAMKMMLRKIAPLFIATSYVVG